MTPATFEQMAFIDLQRGDECRHPPAQSFVMLQFLSCKRCGILFVDGQIELQPVQLERQDPPGERHDSSYMGLHGDKNDEYVMAHDERAAKKD